LLFSADDTRRAARLVDAMWSQPANEFAAQRALAGADPAGIARALAMSCVLLAGVAGYNQKRVAQEMQRIVAEVERQERE
jgi:hypothetical protein